MLSFNSRSLISSAAALSLMVFTTASTAGCGSETVNANINIHGPCQEPGVFQNAAVFHFTVSDGGDPSTTAISADKLRSGGGIGLPKLNAEGGGNIAIAAFDTLTPGAGSQPIASGGTGELRRLSTSGSVDISVMMAPTGRIVPTTDGTPRSIASPGGPDCSVMQANRAGHTTTLLDDGRVLIAGGAELDANGQVIRILQSAEIYDPLTGLFSPAGQTMQQGRAYHTATLLPNGRVLLAGGLANISGALSALVTAEIFDPNSESFTFVSNSAMKAPGGRAHHQAVLTPRDRQGRVRVFLSGGIGTPGGEIIDYHASTEFFEIDSQSFTAGPEMLEARANHTATALQNTAAVIIAGGRNRDEVLRGIEILDVQGAQIGRPSGFTQNANAGDFLRDPHSHHSAGLITRSTADGIAEFVVISGGFRTPRDVGGPGVQPNDFAASAELFRVDTLEFISDTDLPDRFAGGCGAVVGTGEDTRFFLAGGHMPGGATAQGAAMELVMTTGGGGLTLTGNRLSAQQIEARALHGCTTLGNGMVLMTGGLATAAGGPTLGSAELYNP